MTQNELNRFRAILTAKVAELERLARRRDDITIERAADELEQIQQASVRALAICNLDRQFNQLRNARAALRRVQAGSFGVCQRCDEDIHSQRLAAVPWTQFCIGCQEAVDHNPEEAEPSMGDLLPSAA